MHKEEGLERFKLWVPIRPFLDQIILKTLEPNGKKMKKKIYEKKVETGSTKQEKEFTKLSILIFEYLWPCCEGNLEVPSFYGKKENVERRWKCLKFSKEMIFRDKVGDGWENE